MRRDEVGARTAVGIGRNYATTAVLCTGCPDLHRMEPAARGTTRRACPRAYHSGVREAALRRPVEIARAGDAVTALDVMRFDLIVGIGVREHELRGR